MPALHTAVTVSALADGDAEFVHDGTLHRKVFLILRDDAPSGHDPAAIRTARRQRRVVRQVDAGRRPAMRTTAIGQPRLAARSLGIRLRQAPRERCRLTGGAPPRHLEFLFQPLVFAPQSIALDLRSEQILTETFILAPQVLHRGRVARRRRRIGDASRHERVMPERA